MPRSSEHRFWSAVDEMIAKIDRLPPPDPELLRVFLR
jgi:hypothetical protein